jgi:HAE1 family hydrophobic/amphiphilic exporter-1/multidrug efflux pump
MTVPEGASYEYMDRFMQEISQLVEDSVTEKSSPNNHFSRFGSSSVNSGFMRLSLKEAGKNVISA